jgi:hypothetical protein
MAPSYYREKLGTPTVTKITEPSQLCPRARIGKISDLIGMIGEKSQRWDVKLRLRQLHIPDPAGTFTTY